MTTPTQLIDADDLPVLLAAAQTCRDYLRQLSRREREEMSAVGLSKALAVVIRHVKAVTDEGRPDGPVALALDQTGWFAVWYALSCSRALFRSKLWAAQIRPGRRRLILRRITEFRNKVNRILSDPRRRHPHGCPAYNHEWN